MKTLGKWLGEFAQYSELHRQMVEDVLSGGSVDINAQLPSLLVAVRSGFFWSDTNYENEWRITANTLLKDPNAFSPDRKESEPIPEAWESAGLSAEDEAIVNTFHPLGDTPMQRFNEGKPALSYLLELEKASKGVCRVLEYGANKYARNNYKNGGPMSEKEFLLDSMLRHAMSYLNGEDLDEESGLPHVYHMACSAMFAAYHYKGEGAEE